MSLNNFEIDVTSNDKRGYMTLFSYLEFVFSNSILYMTPYFVNPGTRKEGG